MGTTKWGLPIEIWDWGLPIGDWGLQVGGSISSSMADWIQVVAQLPNPFSGSEDQGYRVASAGLGMRRMRHAHTPGERRRSLLA